MATHGTCTLDGTTLTLKHGDDQQDVYRVEVWNHRAYWERVIQLSNLLNGAEYLVSIHAKTCTCPDFRYRGHRIDPATGQKQLCKHVNAILSGLRARGYKV